MCVWGGRVRVEFGVRVEVRVRVRFKVRVRVGSSENVVAEVAPNELLMSFRCVG